MVEILKTLESLIINDSYLESKLAKYNNRLAIFNNLAPEEVDTPYLILSFRSYGKKIKDEIVYIIDVYDRALSPSTVLSISNRIEYLFNNYSYENKKIISIERELFHLLPDEQIDMQHAHLEFKVTALRQELY